MYQALRLSVVTVIAATMISPAGIAAQATGGQPPQSVDSLPPSITLPPDLARVLTDYETAYPKGGQAVADLFAEDGFVLPNGRPPIRGRAAIAAYYNVAAGGPLALRAFAYSVEGNTAYILGGFARNRGDRDGGKFTLALRRQAGKWMIFSDMDNGNSRPMRPAP